MSSVYTDKMAKGTESLGLKSTKMLGGQRNKIQFIEVYNL